jgi:hypothetical protein
MAETNATHKEVKKGFWTRLIDSLDKKMEEKAKKASCCASSDKNKGSSCC